MYYTFVAPHLIKLRENWDNGSRDKCYISPNQESQDKAGNQEKNRQKKEDEKNPIEKHAHESPEACSMVCEAEGLDISFEEWDALENNEDRWKLIHDRYDAKKGDLSFTQGRKCFQWRFQRGVCCVSKSFTLGKPRMERDPQRKWTSGWFVEAINAWIDAKEDCREPLWKEPK